jgi:hypothetical protein
MTLVDYKGLRALVYSENQENYDSIKNSDNYLLGPIGEGEYKYT